MSKITFQYQVTAQLQVEYDTETHELVHKGVGFNLEVSEEVNKDQFVDEKNLPNSLKGHEAVSHTLISALSANIYIAHQEGFMDSAEHLRKMIALLENQFIQNGDVEKGGNFGSSINKG